MTIFQFHSSLYRPKICTWNNVVKLWYYSLDHWDVEWHLIDILQDMVIIPGPVKTSLIKECRQSIWYHSICTFLMSVSVVKSCNYLFHHRCRAFSSHLCSVVFLLIFNKYISFPQIPQILTRICQPLFIDNRKNTPHVPSSSSCSKIGHDFIRHFLKINYRLIYSSSKSSE